MESLVAVNRIARVACPFVSLIFGALVVCVLVVAIANAEEDTLPVCTHWTTTFVFAEVMDRARVRGNGGQKLYLHPVNPQICSSRNLRECKARAYVIPNDIVIVGHICGPWAYVMFPGGPRSTGWVELSRLEILAPDRDILNARKKRIHKPDGPPIVLKAFVGDVVGLRRLVSEDPETLKKHGVVALYAAARQNHFDATRELLDLGVNPNGESGCAQLGFVAAGNSVDILELLVQRDADINCKPGGQEFTPLMIIANTNRGNNMVSRAMGRVTSTDLLAPAKYILARGARFNDVNAFGDSALRIALQSNNVDIADLLLKSGADVNNYIDGDSNPNSTGEQNGHTILMSAIFWFSLRNDPAMIELLLKHGADVNYRSKLKYDEECDRTTSGKCTFRGQTALTRAATEGYYTVTKLLLENGADPLLPREDGRSPSRVACDWKHIAVAELIKKYEDRASGKTKSAIICPKQ